MRGKGVAMTAHPQSAEFETPIARQKSINLALQGGGSQAPSPGACWIGSWKKIN
jgi:hypothetical protein